jgi:hypothetical protein
MGRSSGITLLLALFAFACGGRETPRTIKGRLSSAYETRVNNPVFVAERPDGHAFVSHIRSSGEFAIGVPTGTYRLRIANSQASGKYAVISNVAWPNGQGRTAWARVGPGAPISLGTIRPAGASGDTTQTFGNQLDQQNCGVNDAECVNNTDEVSGLQECDSDDFAVADVDDKQVSQNVEMDVNDPGSDQNVDVNVTCTTDSPANPDGGSPQSGQGGNGAACRVNTDCSSGLSCINSACARVR